MKQIMAAAAALAAMSARAAIDRVRPALTHELRGLARRLSRGLPRRYTVYVHGQQLGACPNH